MALYPAGSSQSAATPKPGPGEEGRERPGAGAGPPVAAGLRELLRAVPSAALRQERGFALRGRWLLQCWHAVTMDGFPFCSSVFREPDCCCSASCLKSGWKRSRVSQSPAGDGVLRQALEVCAAAKCAEGCVLPGSPRCPGVTAAGVGHAAVREEPSPPRAALRGSRWSRRPQRAAASLPEQ